MSDKCVIAIRDSQTDRLQGFLKDFICYKGSTQIGILATTSFDESRKFKQGTSFVFDARTTIRYNEFSSERDLSPDNYVTNMEIDEDGQLDFYAREYFDGKFRMPRDEWQKYFCSLDKECCGWSRSPRENDTFYYKSEAEDTIWDKDGNYQPNFIYKPSGFKMCWYKYPLRSCYANRDIDFDSFKKMVDACLTSLKTQPLKECAIRY